MFNIKKDRLVVEITIEFNISAIDQWLSAGGKFEDIDKIKREKYGAWKDAITQKYVIDMLPIGQTSNAYFHRNKGVISQNIGGIDFLENAKKDVKYIVEKEAKIEPLSWEMWRGCLVLQTQRRLILSTLPLTEVAELEATGILTESDSLRHEEKKIKVPVSFDDEKKPKEFMEIWRDSIGEGSLSYMNGLGAVSFSTLNSEVGY